MRLKKDRTLINLNYDLLDLTKQAFQKYFSNSITDEEAEDIQIRLIRYFELLIEWEKQEKLEKKEEKNE